MINGNKKVSLEADYRNLQLDSSSSLKMFSLDRKKYYRVYVEGSKEQDEEETKASITGRVVECLLLESELFDSRFTMSAIASSPTGLMNEFIEALYRITREATDEQGNITKSFEDASKEAYLASGFKIKYEAVINKFIGGDNEIYFNEILEIRSKGLTVVTAQDVNNAERIVEELKTNAITKDIVNKVDSKKWTVLNQVQVEGYMIDGHLFKSMMDKVIVNHVEKTISIYDLKCTWSVENFLSEYFLYRRSYIQAYLYWCAGYHMVKTIPEYAGYRVEIPQFIVCDSINYYSPLIYVLDEKDMNDAYNGFEHKGKKYPGVKGIIQDLQWAIDHNLWNISRTNYLSNGIVKLTE